MEARPDGFWLCFLLGARRFVRIGSHNGGLSGPESGIGLLRVSVCED